MGRWGLQGALLALLVACAHLPAIDPPPPGEAAAAAALCRTPYPSSPWQFVHAVSAQTPGGRPERLIGVCVVDPGAGTLEAALMTAEGFVVFSGAWDGALEIFRALPPFDAPRFAQGLMADLRLLFFAPEGPPAAVGRTPAGLPVCRYARGDGSGVDVIVPAGRGWEIRAYGPRGRPIRTVAARGSTAAATGSAILPADIEITAHGPNGYRLSLSLISAEAIEGE